MKSFKNAKAAAGRIWERIQSLGEIAKPKAGPKAKGSARAAKGAPAKGKATKKAAPAKKAPKARVAAKTRDAAGPREGSKTAQVVAMLGRNWELPILTQICPSVLGYAQGVSGVSIRPMIPSHTGAGGNAEATRQVQPWRDSLQPRHDPFPDPLRSGGRSRWLYPVLEGGWVRKRSGSCRGPGSVRGRQSWRGLSTPESALDCAVPKDRRIDIDPGRARSHHQGNQTVLHAGRTHRAPE